MSADGRELRVGILGCTRGVANWYLPALRRVGGSRVVAVGDAEPALLERLGRRCPGSRRFADGDSLIRDLEVDAVLLHLTGRDQLRFGLATLRAGKHLLLTKPPAMSPHDARDLAEEARRRSLVAMLGLNMRWHRLVRRARDLIASGALGRVKMIRSTYTCRPDFRELAPTERVDRGGGGGVLVELAAHHLDLWQLLTGASVELVTARSRDTETDDEGVVVSARMSNGVLASGCFARGTSGSQELEVYASGGRLEVSLYRVDGWRWLPVGTLPGQLRTRLDGIRSTVRELGTLLPRRGRGGDFGRSFDGLWRAFRDAVHSGAPDCEASISEASGLLAPVVAARESVRHGRPVEVADPAA